MLFRSRHRVTRLVCRVSGRAEAQSRVHAFHSNGSMQRDADLSVYRFGEKFVVVLFGRNLEVELSVLPHLSSNT